MTAAKPQAEGRFIKAAGVGTLRVGPNNRNLIVNHLQTAFIKGLDCHLLVIDETRRRLSLKPQEKNYVAITCFFRGYHKG